MTLLYRLQREMLIQLIIRRRIEEVDPRRGRVWKGAIDEIEFKRLWEKFSKCRCKSVNLHTLPLHRDAGRDGGQIPVCDWKIRALVPFP